MNQHELLRPFSRVFSFLIRFFDAAIILMVLQVFVFIFNPQESVYYKYAALVTIIIYFLAAELSSTFQSARLENFADITGKIVFAWVLTSIALILLAFLTKTSTEVSRLTITTWLLVTPVILTFERLVIFTILRRIRSHVSNTRSYAILGNPDSTQLLTEKFDAAPWTGLKLVNKFDDLKQLMHQLKIEPIDYVFLSYDSKDHEKIITAIEALNDTTSSVYLVPDLLLSELLDSRWIMLNNTPLIIINDHPFYGGWQTLKRFEDLFLSTLILFLIIPLLLCIALAIKLTSAGPILFKQRRHGLNGEIIKVLKFRTMTVLDDGDVVIQASKDDLRVTSVGKFLRRHSLDELPQFFNVLGGSMSIVGPRPHALAHNDYYRPLIDGYMQRHKVKPGITGWAQVNGLRGETDTIEKMQARVEFDMYYINHWSIGLDLKIILLTIFNGFSGKHVY